MRTPQLLVLTVLLGSACGPSDDLPEEARHHHHHEPPHGGTPVVLGEELYHLEFLIEGGSLHCYVLDGHMHNFVRIQAPSLKLHVDSETASGPAAPEGSAGAESAESEFEIELLPVASRATGETEGDTAHFAGEWPLAQESFSARIPTIDIRGQTFEDISFSHPSGHE